MKIAWKTKPSTAKGAVLALGGLVVALSAFLLLRQPSPEPLDAEPANHHPVPSNHAQKRQPPPTPSAPRPSQPDDAMWVAVDETAVANPPAYAEEWATEGRALVRISAIASNHWQVGDRLTLPLPQLGETYRPVIEEIDEGFGSRALLGKIIGEDGTRRRYVVTVGPASVFAFIDTPQGPYELVADRQQGWLLPTSSMMAEHAHVHERHEYHGGHRHVVRTRVSTR